MGMRIEPNRTLGNLSLASWRYDTLHSQSKNQQWERAMKLPFKAILVAFLKMSQPNNNETKDEDEEKEHVAALADDVHRTAPVAAAVPVADAAAEAAASTSAPTTMTFGVEVVVGGTSNKTSTADDDPQQVQEEGMPPFQIKINCVQFLRDLTLWMKEHHVGQTLREWARQVEWNKQVWTPLKDWARQVQWEKEFWKPLREWFRSVQWRQVRTEVKEAMRHVDWNETRTKMKEGMREVDWTELRQQMKEASQDVNWKQVRQEVKDGLNEVNWDRVRREANELHAEWTDVQSEFQDELKQAVDLGKEVQGEIPADVVDWEMVDRGLLQDVCPDQLDAERARKALAEILQPDAEQAEK